MSDVCNCTCKEKKLWICGQIRGEWELGKTAWDFQGVFDDRGKAVAACRDEKYFIFSTDLNKELPGYPCEAADTCYPVIEKDLE